MRCLIWRFNMNINIIMILQGPHRISCFWFICGIIKARCAGNIQNFHPNASAYPLYQTNRRDYRTRNPIFSLNRSSLTFFPWPQSHIILAGFFPFLFFPYLFDARKELSLNSALICSVSLLYFLVWLSFYLFAPRLYHAEARTLTLPQNHPQKGFYNWHQYKIFHPRS